MLKIQQKTLLRICDVYLIVIFVLVIYKSINNIIEPWCALYSGNFSFASHVVRRN